MRLLRLELSGFKSFPDKYSVNFVQDGVTIVVGPNGCGKSNIVDAIRWALGEQSAKHLRGAEMQDVIFNGSAARKPVGMAQVSLVFANDQHDTLPKYREFSELSVTRRLFRSGESAYLINKTPCRLADIRELFMDTGIGGQGYSIIEQGRIDRIVTSRPLDRRALIDEAAGIVKYKIKKKEAEKKLEKARENLDRVKDIVGELSEREGVLKKQVEKAEEFLAAKARFERLSQCLVAYRWQGLKSKADELADKREASYQGLQGVQVAYSLQETKASQLDLEITQKDQGLADLRTRMQNQREEVIKQESKIQSLQLELKNLEEWDQKGEEEKQNLEDRLERLERQLTGLEEHEGQLEEESQVGQEALVQVMEEIKVIDGRLAQLLEKLGQQKKLELDLLGRLSREEQEAKHLQEKLLGFEDFKSRLLARMADLERQKAEFDQNREVDQKRLQDKESQKDQLQAALLTAQQRQEEIKDRVMALGAQINHQKDQINQRQARLESLRELLETRDDFEGGTKAFFDYLDQNPVKAADLGFVGALPDLLQEEVETSPQLTAFLNRYFQLLVFESGSKLAAIRDLVHQQGWEQVELCFLNQASAKHSSLGEVFGGLPLADGYQMLDRPLFASDFKPGLGVVDRGQSLITPEGVVVLGDPGRTGKAEQFLKRKQEVEELEQLLLDLEEGLAPLTQNLEELQEEAQEVTRLEKRSQEQLREVELELVALGSNLQAKAREEQRLEQDRQAAQKELEQGQAQQEGLQSRSEELQASLQALRGQQAEAAALLDRLESDLEEERLNKEDKAEEAARHQASLAGVKEKLHSLHQMRQRAEQDMEQARKELLGLSDREARMQEKKEQLELGLKEARSALPLLIQDLHGLEEENKGKHEELDQSRQAHQECQKEQKRLAREMASLQEEVHQLDIQLAQLAQEAHNLETSLFEEESLSPEELLGTMDLEDFDPRQVESEVARLKTRVKNLENVNLAAREEYDELVQRLQFLTEQSEDLLASIESLEESIEKMNLESRRRFKASFQEINQGFAKLFPVLFGGGEAFLKLTEEEDLLDAGVEIIAQPPGKKLQNMTLLSGGEKALTAIALIFAIFLIKPSPFCLLDEVDAPLDDANNHRFNQQVLAMTKNSQFIIITHNKRTMEIGDALFGVTMEEPGSSKIVSVQVHQKAPQSA